MRMKKKLYKRHGDKRKEKPSDVSVYMTAICTYKKPLHNFRLINCYNYCTVLHPSGRPSTERQTNLRR